MDLLPKRPYIKIPKACEELDCDIDDLIYSWLTRQIDFYYILQGEKISINYLCEYGLLGKKSITYLTRFFNDDLTQLYIVEGHRKNDNYVNVTGKGYGAFIIKPMQSTRLINEAIYIISPKHVIERNQKGLITSGYCHLFHPKTKDIVVIDDACTINGLKVPLNNLFVMRNDINKFIESSECELSKDPRYWINVAAFTQNHYIQQNIIIPKGKLAAKVASIAEVAQSTVMKDWFKDTSIKTEAQLKKSNKHGNKPVDDFDLFNPETGVKV